MLLMRSASVEMQASFHTLLPSQMEAKWYEPATAGRESRARALREWSRIVINATPQRPLPMVAALKRLIQNRDQRERLVITALSGQPSR